MKRTKILVFVSLSLSLFIYYQIDYKRYFISNAEDSECFTIWPRLGNECLIIPGKYYGFLNPEDNFISTVTHNNYVGVVWRTGDSAKYKLSLFNDYKVNGLDNRIEIYSSNEKLLSDYKIVRSPFKKENDSTDYYKRQINYEYIDLNRVWGIKRFKW